MLNFLYGQDTYRSKEELRRMIEKNKGANTEWLDFIRIDAGDKQIGVFEELKKTVNTVSMFGAQKTIVIENVFDLNKDEQEKILEFLKNRKIEDDKNVILIFWAEQAEEKNDLCKHLKSKAECKESKSLEGAQLKKWIKDFVDEQKGSIDNLALDKLIEGVGNDLWRLSNELNKLIAYKMGDVRRPTSDAQDVGRLTSQDVDLFIKSELDLKIFDLIDAIGYKNKAKALKLFNQHINEGDDEYYLLSMIVYQIRNLIKVKATKNIQLLGLHPFVARKSEQQVSNFTYEELKKIYRQLMTIDFESKLGKISAQTSIEKLIIEL
jgi:DNA polymerase-3 subunit delta